MKILHFIALLFFSFIANAQNSSIRLIMTGGANAGKYTTNSEKTTCSCGLTGEKSFGNQFSQKGAKDNEFSSLQLIIDDKDAALKGTNTFYVKVAFGKILVGKKYEIDGRNSGIGFTKKLGKGICTLTKHGKSYDAHIVGETSDGVKIEATLVCNKTMFKKNEQYIEE
ncbi:hypothetical protein EMA8858_00638 [Emticicia aquatica]|uniref:Uncharacterized protein n=1 Tax=Emticicia aquatica TaxID=1681835 RepID=A0ABM9ALC0_9BACT|nr:hypothetical protein [Emticicia aquatica]CAH0994528.1 hypothetical protein EMA8858_00638 [Emticicia aquatica]